MSSLTIIGRAERIDLPRYGLFGIPAKIDTGADSSSIWATGIVEKDGALTFTFFGPSSKYFTGETVSIPTSQYMLTRISNSFGQKEVRYTVKLLLVVQGRKIRATVTLANRANKTYPVLLGRRMLNKKFIVDVSKGQPLLDVEQRKKKKMQRELSNFKQKAE